MTSLTHIGLAEVALNFAHLHPEEPSLSWLETSVRPTQSLNAGQVAQRALALSGYLRREVGLEPGTSVLLAHPPSIEFAVAFLGCVVGGLLPVPVFSPNPMDGGASKEAMLHIARHSQAQHVLTTGQYITMRQMVSEPDYGLQWHASDAIAAGAFEHVVHRASTDDVAFVQYTSGSTSNPCGVAITHANIMHQLRFHQSRQGGRMNPGSVGVIWIPQYHDMGLIGGVLHALTGDLHLYMMSPLTFLSQPSLWWEAISTHRATHTAAPDFGYALSVRRTTAEQRAAWDLSSLQLALCGAEPVRQRTLDQFMEAFGPCGMSLEAFCPAYGLAEHTLAVSFAPNRPQRATRIERQNAQDNLMATLTNAQDDDDVLEVMPCGKAPHGIHVKVVDPQTRALRPTMGIGEIWLNSPSCARPWNPQPEQLERYNAQLAQDDGRRYLRTGDLGFVDAEGQIHITGRLRDLIILGGRNHFPHDLEHVVREAHPNIRPGGVMVFGVPSDGVRSEALVAAVEVRSAQNAQETATAVQNALANAGLPRAEVLALPKGALKKTSSGKLRRAWHREAFIAGQWPQNAHWRAQASAPTPNADMDTGRELIRRGLDLQNALTDEARRGLVLQGLTELADSLRGQSQDNEVLPHLNLLVQGFDSLMMVELEEAVGRWAGQGVAEGMLGQTETLEQAAHWLVERALNAQPQTTAAQRTRDTVLAAPIAPDPNGFYPLAPAQRWTLDVARSHPNEPHANTGGLIHLHGDSVDTDRLEEAVQRVLETTASLRTRFVERDGQYRAALWCPEASVESRRSFAAATHPEAAMRAWATDWVRAPYDVLGGPLARAASFELSPNHAGVAMGGYHGVIDAVAQAGALRRLMTAYHSPELIEPEAVHPHLEMLEEQRQRRIDGQHAEDMHWWAKTLATLPEPAEEVMPGHHAALASTWKLSAQALAGLDGIMRTERLSAANVMTGILGLLYGQERQLQHGAIAFVVMNRNAQTRDQISNRAHGFPMAFDWQPHQHLKDVLAQVRQRLHGVLSHSGVGMEEVFGELKRQGRSNPCIWSVNYYETFSTLRMGGITLSMEELYHGARRSPMSVVLIRDRSDNTMHLQLQHRLCDIDRAEARRLAGKMIALLEAAPRHMDTSIDRFMAQATEASPAGQPDSE